MSLDNGKRGVWMLAGVALLLVIASMVAGCGGSSSAATTTTPPATTHATTSKPTSTAPATATKPVSSTHAGGLSGTWSGQYGGAFTGTFKLHWTQTGTALAGGITLSSPGDTLGIHGTLNGSAIRFGTVGSMAITYTGTVSGSSMSGSYRTPQGGGSWSANKS
jgi:hypothetical protein